MLKHKRLFQRLLIVVGLVLFAGATTKLVLAQDVTQGYGSTTTLQNGLIVELDPNNSSDVEPVTSTDAANMLGVTVGAGNSPVSLSNNGAASQVYVATYGQYDVLVSNQDGAVKTGDFITISSLDGVGMKAGSNQTIIIGKALGNFDGSTNVVSTATVGGAAVSLGYVQVDISVAHNPLYQKQTTTSAGVPSFLARAAQVVTNKPLGAARIYAGLVVLLVSVLVAGGLLIAGVRSSMTAIGRNPLARHSIMRGLMQVILLALIIVSAGLVAVYLLLKV
jgi:hypothetical protein